MIKEFSFDKKKCWYNQVCGKFGTPDCNSSCLRYIKMFSLANSSLLTEKQQKTKVMDVPLLDRGSFVRLNEIKQNSEEYIKNGNNLVIQSQNSGNGKTSWAIKILMSYFDDIWYRAPLAPVGLFVNVPTFIFETKSSISGQESDYLSYVKENITKVDVVVWDDIGLKTLTPYEQDLLYAYINRRIEFGKSNIYTTNLLEDSFSEFLGTRLHSRVYNLSEVITFSSIDYRRIQTDGAGGSSSLK